MSPHGIASVEERKASWLPRVGFGTRRRDSAPTCRAARQAGRVEVQAPVRNQGAGPQPRQKADVVNDTVVPVQRELSFDRFRLLPRQRLLLEGSNPVRLGSRALDLLVVLAERSGEPISKSELIATVWPDTFVDDANLKVQIAGLRRALADGRGGRRYISTVAGRGYCFVAPVTVAGGGETPASAGRPGANHRSAPLTRPVVTDEGVGEMTLGSPDQRLVGFVGAQGDRKTEFATGVVRLTAALEDDVWVVDLTPLSALMPGLAPSIVIGSEDHDQPGQVVG
jgi:DNA-binding winged helix-turn-helix (wHTH) protein